jgi:glycopeptide antibiotics resistance protein
MQRANKEKPKIVSLILFGIYLLALTWSILFKLQFHLPYALDNRVINLIPLMGSLNAVGILSFGEITLNIIAFAPFGIYSCMLKPSWPTLERLAMIAGLSLTYEATQFIFAIGRADITDVLSNTLGGAIGIGIYALASLFLKDKTSKAATITAAASTALVLIFAVGFMLTNRRWIMLR